MAVLSGLLLCILFFSSSGRGKKIDIIQKPEVVNASVGNSVTMTCSWVNCGEVEGMRVKWLKRNLSDSSPLNIDTKGSNVSSGLCDITENMEKYPVPLRQVSVTTSCKFDNESGEAILHLTSLELGDTGLYWCRITAELPAPFANYIGNGTSLTVKENGGENENGEQKHYNKLAILLIFLLGIPVCFYCKRMQKPRNKARRITEEAHLEEIEIHEFHLEGNGERRETDSSSSSAEWMASTCYESVDYFAMKPNDIKGGACP